MTESIALTPPDLSGATDEQRRAVLSRSPLVCCVAGPGSGKTQTLTWRVLSLLAEGVDPARIVVITFTNTGAIALAERLGNIKLRYVGTLHGFMLELLQKHGAHLGYDQRITVLELDKSRDVADANAKLKPATEVLEEARKKCCPSAKLGMLINYRNNPQHVRALASVSAKKAADMEEAVKRYLKLMRAMGCVDFDTILSDGLRVAHLADKIEHLFVDEAQDSGDADFAIYRAMPANNRFFVGDSDQGIFQFRGGNPEHLNRLCLDSAADAFKLEINFRSDVKICEAAQRLIEHNVNRFPKKVVPFSANAGEIRVHRFASAEEEVSGVVALVRERIGEIPSAVAEAGKLAAAMEIAVLTRNNAEVSAIAKALLAAGIPVRQRVEGVKDTNRRLRAAIQMLNSPSDAAVLEFLRFDQPIWRIDGWRSQARLKQKPVREMCGDRRVPQEPMPHLWGGELLNQLNRLGCGKDEIETARESIANIATPSLSTLALALRPGDAREVGEGVTCTTLHGSKGREFDHVIMAACEDSMVPGTRKCTDVEEERRLFFVGLTRARRSVDVTWSVIRAREYGDPFTEHQPSRFIAQAVI